MATSSCPGFGADQDVPAAGQRRIETRFFVRHPGGDWSGYTYEWNEAGTDAVLVGEGNHGKRRSSGRPYRLPSRAECKQCHTAAAGGSLGLEIAQLNTPVGISHGEPACGLGRTGACSRRPLPAPPSQLPALARAGDAQPFAGVPGPGVPARELRRLPPARSGQLRFGRPALLDGAGGHHAAVISGR